MKTLLPYILLLLLLLPPPLRSAPIAISRVEPPHWWVGMKHGDVQLMVYGKNLNGARARFNTAALKVLSTRSVPSPSYTFVDVRVPKDLPAGNYTLTLEKDGEDAAISFPIFDRLSPVGRYRGFDPGDVIYLIMPDRFANGDTTNDTIQGLVEHCDRGNPSGRHGGDLQGIINKLDYLRDLGVTAIWITPLTENRGSVSYHGYASTDLYRIDARFGTNELYAALVDEAHKRGLKIVMDHVNNHIGIAHPWIQDLPTPEWLNGSVGDHQRPYHGKIEIDDIHSDSATKSRARLGWFNDVMPDLNQACPLVKNYLIQNTLWWIESTGLDGIREDTYPYIDPGYAAEWCSAILEEYPHMNIVGEVWVGDPVYLAPYQRGRVLSPSASPALPSLTDFALYDTFTKIFKDRGSIGTMHETLTKDFLYPDPSGLVTFLDNHDTQRIMFKAAGDVRRFKLALQLLLTTRGIPQLLYGTEIGMMGERTHGAIRSDFPGGFPGDGRNAFTVTGRTSQENEIFDFVRNLLRFRQRHSALRDGTLVHFTPADEVYAYVRASRMEKILVVANNNAERRSVSLFPFLSQLKGATNLVDLKTGLRADFSPHAVAAVDGYDVALFQIVGKEH